MPTVHPDRRYITPPGQPEPPKKHWHLEKSISAGHLLTTLAIILSSFWYLANERERVSLIEQSVAINKQRIAMAESVQMRTSERIDAKLDRIWDSIREMGKR